MALPPSTDDIDDFLERVNDVTAKLEAIKSGEDVDTTEYDVVAENNQIDIGEIAARIKKVNPDAVLTPEQEEALRKHEQEKELERIRKKKAREEADAEREREKKEEERKNWWRHAEYEYGHLHEVEEEAEPETKEEQEEAPRRDVLDYSHWEQWLKNPDDPVSQEMLALAQKKIEDDKNDEFERNNPEFCAAFRADMAKRRKASETKEEKALKLKDKGNRAFAKKLVRRALRCYEEALELKFDIVPVLTNIAQCHLRLHQYDDCLEYCNRALYVQPENIKALSRRAKVHRLTDPPKYHLAVQDLTQALKIDPDNKSLRRELEETQVAQAAAKDEEVVMRDAESRFSDLASLFEKLKQPDSFDPLQQQLIIDMIAALPESQVYLRANGQLEWLTVTASSYFERLFSELDSHTSTGPDDGGETTDTMPVLSKNESQHLVVIVHLLRATGYDPHNLSFIRKSRVFRASIKAATLLIERASGGDFLELSCGTSSVNLVAALLRLLVRGAADVKCQKLMVDGGSATVVKAAAATCLFSRNKAILSAALDLCASFAAWTDHHDEVVQVLKSTTLLPDCCAVLSNPACTAVTREKLADVLASASHHKDCHPRFADVANVSTTDSTSNSKKSPSIAGLLLDLACSKKDRTFAREQAAMALINAGLEDKVRDSAVAHGINSYIGMIIESWAKQSKGNASPSLSSSIQGGGVQTSTSLKLLARLSRSRGALAALRERSGTLRAITEMLGAAVRACGDVSKKVGPKGKPRSVAVLAAVKNLVQIIAVCLHGGASVPQEWFNEFFAADGVPALTSCVALLLDGAHSFLMC